MDNRKNSKDWLKEVTVIIALISLVIAVGGAMITQMSYVNNTFASIASLNSVRDKTISNAKEIYILKKDVKSSRSVLCGMAIDMKLPTAKKHCKTFIDE